MLVPDRNLEIVLKTMIIDIFEGVRLYFFHFFNFFEQKNRNSHVLKFNYWTFWRKISKLSILFVLIFHSGIYQKNTIIDVLQGVRLHFFFSLFWTKNRNSHVLVFNFGGVLRETVKLSILVLLDTNFGIYQKNIAIDYFECVRLHIFYFCQIFFKQKNRNSHVYVFNFGAFFRKTRKFTIFFRSRQKYWKCFENHDN